jgi:hypothetical protein
MGADSPSLRTFLLTGGAQGSPSLLEIQLPATSAVTGEGSKKKEKMHGQPRRPKKPEDGAAAAAKAAKLRDLQAQVLHNHHSRT